MKHEKNITKGVVVLSIVLIMTFFGCSRVDNQSKENNETRSNKKESAVKKVNEFKIELDSKEKIIIGDSLEMTLKVKNDAGQIKTVTYGSPRRHDFEVLDSEGNTVWCKTCKEFFIQTTVDETLGVDQEIEYTATWSLDDNEGNQVGTGVYILKASWLALENGGSVEKKIEITK